MANPTARWTPTPLPFCAKCESPSVRMQTVRSLMQSLPTCARANVAVDLFGAPADGSAAWAATGRRVGEAVIAGEADFGVVCCWTGTGVSIAANKVDGVRAALCADAHTAEGARRWNDANVLALSMRLTTPALGLEILGAFIRTTVTTDSADRAEIDKLER